METWLLFNFEFKFNFTSVRLDGYDTVGMWHSVFCPRKDFWSCRWIFAFLGEGGDFPLYWKWIFIILHGGGFFALSSNICQLPLTLYTLSFLIMFHRVSKCILLISSKSMNFFLALRQFGLSKQLLIYTPLVLWCCWLGNRKGICLVKNLNGGMLVWLCVWGEVQICIWPSWCHYHSLFLVPVNPDWFYLPGAGLPG